MKPKLLCLILFQFAIFVCKAQLNANEIYKISSNYIVSIEVEDTDSTTSTGTGFYFADINAVVTNYHVIKGFEKIRISYSDGKYSDGPFKIETDSKNDIAILSSAEGLNFTKGLNANSGRNEVGEKIFVIGNPLGLNNTVTEGIISSIRKGENDDFIQFTAPVSHGSSGSPLLNEDGQVIGVVSFQFEKGQNLNFAIPIRFVLDLAARYPTLSKNNEEGNLGGYSSIETNKLLLLADSLFKAKNGAQSTGVMKAILQRSDIQDSLFVEVALEAIKQNFFLNLDKNFVHSYSDNFYYFYDRSLSPDELDELLGKSIELINNYSYNAKIITEVYVLTGYYCLKENDCRYAYLYFQAALSINDTSSIALNGMSDFYRAYSKEVSKSNDTNYICKEKSANFVEPDSVNYYLTKIIRYHPKFYDGYLKLIDFYFDKRSGKYCIPNVAFNYFLKCYQLDPKNSLALKTYFNNYFWYYRETTNIAIYQKIEHIFLKYSQLLESKSQMAIFLAEKFKESADRYDYNSKERKILLKTAIKYYKKDIDFFLIESKNKNYNSKNITTTQKTQDPFLQGIVKIAEDIEKKHPYNADFLCNTYLNISELYMSLKDFENAYLYIDKSLKLDPDYYKIYKTLGNYYQNKILPDYVEAIFSYKKYMETVPSPEYDLLTDLATCYYFNREFDNAEKYFKEVKDECDDCYFNTYLLALLYTDTNKKAEAIKLYNELVEAKEFSLSNDLQKILYPK